MIVRKMTIEYSFICFDERNIGKLGCIGNRTNWHTQSYVKPILEERDYDFPQSLVMWRDRVVSQFEKLLDTEGEKNCRDTAEYLSLCQYEYYVIDVSEEGSPTVPKFILDRIQYMLELYNASDDIDEKLELMKEINRLKDEYGVV